MPKLSWLIDQAFNFIDEVVEKQLGLEHPLSVVVCVVLFVLVSYLPMMIINSIISVFPMRSQKKFENQ